MRKLALLTWGLAALAGAAQANGMPSGTSATTAEMPAVATPSSTNPTAPVQGRNSFTEAQARSRIAKAGFTNISALTKGEDGIWRATAKKAKKSHQVALDYQGNVTVDK
jgi:hypothetical protein